jgi:hypothetical protein
VTTWTSGDLAKIGAAEEVQVSSLRRDGTLTNPVTIWAVRVGDNFYVRSVNGRSAAWFRSTQVRHEGRIRAVGIERDVTFVDVDNERGTDDQIDAAYHSKYRRYPSSVAHIISAEARSATIKLVPR